MKTNKLVLKAGSGSTKISLNDAMRLFGADAIQAGEKRGDITCQGPWSICTKYIALATTATWKPGPTHDYVNEYTLHGNRTITRPRQSGYNLEGFVSIDGKKRSCFTSSILFEIEETKQLINVDIIHVRTNNYYHSATVEVEILH